MDIQDMFFIALLCIAGFVFIFTLAFPTEQPSMELLKSLGLYMPGMGK